MYRYFQNNPCHKYTGDCVIRACSKALNKSWADTYMDLCLKGLSMCKLPNDNDVWGAYLKDNHFTKNYYDGTVEVFAETHPFDTYVVGTGSHAICIIDSQYFDTWDSGDETIIYYFKRGE